MPLTRTLRALSAAIKVGSVLPVAVEAQTKLEVTPFVAGFIPISPLGSIRVPLINNQPTVVDGEMKTSGAFGGRISMWAAEQWGLEGTFFFASSDLRITSGVFSRTFDAQMKGG